MIDFNDPFTLVCLFTAAALILSIVVVGIWNRRANKAEDEAYRWSDHQ